MSRRRLPWYRAYSDLHVNEDYVLMTLEEQAAYRNLSDYAAEQSARGTFQMRDVEALARRVSAGRVDVLRSMLAYCTTQWVGAGGEPEIVVDGDRGRFSGWSQRQRPPSAEPEAVGERQRRYKERNNAQITSHSQLGNEQVEEEERNRSSSGGGSKTTNHADATETAAACSALGVPVSDTGATELVGKTTAAYPDVPHGLETVKCREHYRRSWPSKSPEQRALTYSKWCEKIPVFRQQDAERFGPARASPNGRHPPQTPYTPADPDEEAWWKNYDEELKRKNRERQQGNAPDRP